MSAKPLDAVDRFDNQEALGNAAIDLFSAFGLG
jgi:hypothetical protein